MSRGRKTAALATRCEHRLFGDIGIPTGITHDALGGLGFSYVRTWRKGLFISNYGELVDRGILPEAGSMILRFRDHVSAVVDGEIRDTYDTRDFVVRGAYLMNVH